MKTKIAYIDDNSSNLDFIGLILSESFQVEPYQDPEIFLKQYPHSGYEAILVDIHMPKMDGFLLYEKILEEKNYNGCPVIFISSDDTDETRIKSFSLGAVDFLNRLMKPEEIQARIKSKILFFKKHRSVIEFSSLKLNLTLLKAFLNNEELKLTFIEFKLLSHFVRSYPESTTKEEMAEKVWGNGNVLDATIHTHLSNLNAKLEKWDHQIITERNKGSSLSRKQD